MAGRRRDPAGAEEASPARAPTPCPFVPRGPGVPLQVGERSGGGGESRWRPGPRAARSACAGAPLGAGLGLGAPGRAGCSGRRARLIVPRVRGRPAARGAAQVGGGRARGGGRRARARRVVGVSVFFSPTPPGTLAGAGRPPGPAGAVRAAAAGPASGACRARQLVRSIVAEPGSHLASPPPPLGSPDARAPLETPARPGPAPRSELPAAAREGVGGAAPGKRDRPGNLRERWGVAGAAASPGPRRGTRGVPGPARAAGSPAPCPRGAGTDLGGESPPRCAPAAAAR